MTDTGNHTQDDTAPDRIATHVDKEIDAPHARRVEPKGDDEKHDHLADKEAEAEDRQEALVDEGIEETFPASDPVSAKRIT